MPRSPLTYDDGPLVWVGLCGALHPLPSPTGFTRGPREVCARSTRDLGWLTDAHDQVDCEMTGLEDTDVIIEIAVIITNGRLEPVDEGIDYVIRTEKSVLDA